MMLALVAGELEALGICYAIEHRSSNRVMFRFSERGIDQV